MKYSLLKYYVTAFFLCLSSIIVAQDPGSGSNDNGIDDAGTADTDGLPIDNYLWVLIVVALILVFLKYRSMQSKAVNE